MKTNQDNYELVYQMSTALKNCVEMLEMIAMADINLSCPAAITAGKMAIEKAEQELAN